MAENYSVKAILSAVDRGFSSTLKSCTSALDKVDSKISGFSFGILTGAGQAAFNALSGGVSNLIGEIDSSNAAWKTFDANMQMVCGTTDEAKNTIAAAKKTMQDYATKTVYSASDMATTYSQLAAVGIKNTDKLVTGFGGLAAAAENPQQAMKTLSQQATQMAAKPTVAWQDFKLMLEQTPAGIAAVAKHMNMTTSELVTAVQEGKVSTEDFFNAISEVGNNPAFSDLAMQAKTVGQAIDGMKEGLANKLQPAFDTLSKAGIAAVDALSKKLEAWNTEDLAGKIYLWLNKASRYWEAFKTSFSGVWKEIVKAGSAIKASMAELVGAFGSNKNVMGFKDIMDSVAGAIKKVANFCEKHSGAIAKIITLLPKLLIGMKGFQLARKAAAFLMPFGKAIGSIATSIGSKLSSKLFSVAKGTEATGEAAQTSANGMLSAAKAFMMMGAGVLMVAVGMGILAASAIALANSGGLAIGVMAGLVVGLAGLGVGMALLLKTLAPMGAQLMPVATAMLALGGAVVLVAAGFAILAFAAISLANAGAPAILCMVGMVAAMALLAYGAASLAVPLAVGAAGFIAFGAAVVLVATGILIASAAMVLLSTQLPVIAQYGLQASVAILALGAAMLVFGAGALVAGAGCIVLAAGMAASSVAVVALGVAMAAAAVGVLALSVALKGVKSSMESIANSAKTASSSLKSMVKAVNVVESGLNGLGSKAKGAMNKLTSAFNSAASKAISAGQKVGQGFTKGVQTGLASAPSIASAMVAATTATMMSGYGRAYSAGAYIGQGLANGMRSQLSAVRSVATQLAAAAQAAIEARARIASPSKVTTKLGEWFGEGFVNGIAAMTRSAWNAAENLVSIPSVQTPNLALAYGGELSADYDYYRNAQYVIEVPLSVDGKEFARANATYMQNELDTRQTRERRKQGRL